MANLPDLDRRATAEYLGQSKATARERAARVLVAILIGPTPVVTTLEVYRYNCHTVRVFSPLTQDQCIRVACLWGSVCP